MVMATERNEMDVEKKKQLAKKGWVSTSVQDFLGLPLEEIAYIEQEKHLKMNETSQIREKSA